MASVALVAAALVAGCSQEQPKEPKAAAPPAAAPSAPAPATTGAIEARIVYAGAPAVEILKINKDVEVCGQETRIEQIVVGDGQGLAHAVVSVAGLEGPPTSRSVQVDQRACQFRPQVVAMQVGDLEILNSDGVLHNIHTYSDANPPINKAQPKFKKTMTEVFAKPEIVKITCDVHSWMLGWIVVLAHPYFGVTDARGVARIEGVPAGTHTVEVWHAALGRRAADVTVKAGETSSMRLEFPKKG